MTYEDFVMKHFVEKRTFTKTTLLSNGKTLIFCVGGDGIGKISLLPVSRKPKFVSINNSVVPVDFIQDLMDNKINYNLFESLYL